MAQYRRTIVRRMGPTRIVVLGLAMTSGLFAFRMAGDAAPPAPEPERIVVEADVEDVLVATAEIRRGGQLDQTNLKWQSWPRVAITPALIRKSEAPRFIEENKGAQARVVFSPLEPIRRDRLTRDERSGALAEIIPVGSRAVAISIDANGNNTAGGFVLPQDRVDVIRTYLVEDGQRHGAETLLKNVRVLAIGRNVEQKEGESGVLGMTATLEVDVRQAEKLILAQRTGQLSLTLRGVSEPAREEPKSPKAETVAVVTVVRNGARQDYTVRGAQPETPPAQSAQARPAAPQAPRESVKIASRASL